MRIGRNAAKKGNVLVLSVCLLFLVAGWVTHSSSCKAAEQSLSLLGTGRELGRGVTNVAFCWLEIPREVETRIRSNSPGAPFSIISNAWDVTFGTMSGTVQTAERAVGGAVEVGLSPFPPYDPLMHPAMPPYLNLARESSSKADACGSPDEARFESIEGTHYQTITKEVPFQSGGTLSVNARNGSIAVSSWDKPAVKVTAKKQMEVRSASFGILGILFHSSRPFRTIEEAKEYFEALKVDISGDETHVTVKTVHPSQSKNNVNLSMSYEVRAPREIVLAMGTRNGSVSVAGVDGEMRLTSRNGSVICRDVAGSVVATTRNGPIKVVHPRPLEVSANIVCETRNGGIDLTLPRDSSFDISASSDNGTISTDFPVTLTGTVSQRRLSGKVGDGGASVTLRTRNGSIAVRRIPETNG